MRLFYLQMSPRVVIYPIKWSADAHHVYAPIKWSADAHHVYAVC